MRGLRKVARHTASSGRICNSSMLSTDWAAIIVEIESKSCAGPRSARGRPLSLAAPFPWPPDSRGVPPSWGFDLARPGWVPLALSRQEWGRMEESPFCDLEDDILKKNQWDKWLRMFCGPGWLRRFGQLDIISALMGDFRRTREDIRPGVAHHFLWDKF